MLRSYCVSRFQSVLFNTTSEKTTCLCFIALRDSLTHRLILQLPPTQANTSTDYTEAFISLLQRTKRVDVLSIHHLFSQKANEVNLKMHKIKVNIFETIIACYVPFLEYKCEGLNCCSTWLELVLSRESVVCLCMVLTSVAVCVSPSLYCRIPWPCSGLKLP